MAVEGVAFNNDGSKLYLLENNGGIIQQHTLSTQFDVSTASAEYTVYNGVNWSRDLVFNTDGTKAFTINPSTDILYEYTLTTPFDIGTMQLAFPKGCVGRTRYECAAKGSRLQHRRYKIILHRPRRATDYPRKLGYCL